MLMRLCVRLYANSCWVHRAADDANIIKRFVLSWILKKHTSAPAGIIHMRTWKGGECSNATTFETTGICPVISGAKIAKYHLNGSLQKRKNEARYVDTRPIIETGISELVPNIIDKPGPTRQIILQP